MTFPREIEYFLTIVREGNLSKAADKLFITQPALSKFLTKIEGDVGTKLVLRNTTNIVLTPAGELYYEAAVKAYDILYSASRRIEDVKTNGPTRLTLGVPSLRTQNAVANFTAPLFDKYRMLTLSTVEDTLPELRRKLLHNEIDLAIMGYIDDDDPELDCFPLYTTELQLAVNENHPLAKTNIDAIDIHDIADERFVIPSKGNIFRTLIDKYCEEQGITINPLIETKGKNAALLYVQAGTAIGFFQKEHGVKLDGIKYINLKQPVYHKVGIFHKRGEYTNSVATEFTKLAYEYYSKE